MKKRTIAALLALLLILALTACGAGGNLSATSEAPSAPDHSAPADAAEMEEMGMAYDTGSAASGSTAANSKALADQKMIYTASLELETTSFEEAAESLARLTEQLEGYIQQSDVGNTGYRWANYTIRVPVAQYQRFLDQAGEFCHETWRSTSQENITESYYDTAGRLETQKIKLERLQTLLSQATAMEDIIAIESAISETEWTIEDLSGTLRHYDALVDYATISVNLSEVSKLSSVEEAPIGFGGRLGAAFSGGLKAFASGLENLAVALAYGWLWIVLLAGIAVVAVLLVRRCSRKRKALRQDQTTQAEQPPRQEK